MRVKKKVMKIIGGDRKEELKNNVKEELFVW